MQQKMPVMVLQAWNSRTGAYDPVLVDGDYDGEYFSGFRWRVTPSGHIQSVEKLNDGKAYYLSNMVLKPKKGYVIHHKNRNLADNRSENLMYITKKERAAIRDAAGEKQYLAKRNPKSGYRWVLLRTNGRPYPEYIVGIKAKYYGTYRTAEEAAVGADRAAIQIFGYDKVKKVLNFPSMWEEKYGKV